MTELRSNSYSEIDLEFSQSPSYPVIKPAALRECKLPIFGAAQHELGRALARNAAEKAQALDRSLDRMPRNSLHYFKQKTQHLPSF